MGSRVSVPRSLWRVVSGAGAPELESTASVIVVQGLSCSEACGNLLRSGIEPVSPVLAGKFFTTEPPGKPKATPF